MSIFSDAATFWKTATPSLTDEGAIVSKLITDYNAPDNSETAAKVHLVWNAWPGVANQLGTWDPKNIKPYFQALGQATNLSSAQLASIPYAIADLLKEGKLSQAKVDPQRYIAATNATKAAVEKTSEAGPSFLTSLLGISPSTITWIKWGSVGIGALLLLFLIKPYMDPILAGAKKITSKMKKKEELE
jgi:hypothetical protein